MHRVLTALLSFVVLGSVALHGQSTRPPDTHQDVSMPISPSADPDTSTMTEDWSSIRLPKGGLPLITGSGIPLSQVQLQGCTREIVRMQWRSNDPIDVYVIRPDGPGKTHVALFLYSYLYDTDIFREDRWCDRAKENGYAVVGFASALSWPRLHSPRPMKEWFVSELQEALAASTHDVQMVLNCLATRDDLDVERVAIFGQSSGGAIAILAAAADPRIRALALVDPWGDWPDFLHASRQIPEPERASYLTPDFLQNVSTLDPVNYLPLLTDRALCTYLVSDDLTMPPNARDKMAAAAPASDPVMRYTDRDAEARALGPNGITGWMGKQLSPSAAARSSAVCAAPSTP